MSVIIDAVSDLTKTVFRAAAPSRGTPSKSERTRAAIFERAFEFLWNHQFRDLTVNELMAPLPVGRSAFYQYFSDLHGLMETMLHDVEYEILGVANPWFAGEADAVPALRQSLAELVRVSHARGPILRAVHDAAASDYRLEQAWNAFLGRFDTAVAERIERDQAKGLTPRFDPVPVAIALNRMDAYAFIQAFGRRPRQPQEPVLDGITRIWLSTLYPGATR
jgi:AcrR family transcriptional regulator